MKNKIKQTALILGALCLDENKGNIYPIIIKHNRYYEEKLKDFVQEDKIPSYWRDDDNKAEINISFGYILATLSIGWLPWEKLRIKTNPDKMSAEEYINFILNKLKLKRFRDEDNGKMGLFIQENEAWCLINPDFPNGWWENHTLDKFRN